MLGDEMKIENVKWIELAPADGDKPAIMSGVKATIDGQEIFVPMSEGNRHWDEIKKQVDAGDLTIKDAE